MRKFLPIFLLLVAVPIFAQTQTENKIKHTVVGVNKYFYNFKIPQLNRETTIAVHLPDDYEQNAAATYPVLYMLDGQNLFDVATSFKEEWRVDETLAELSAAGKGNGLIVVGIYNSAFREEEYFPYDHYKSKYKKTKDDIVKGDGQKYSEFIVKTLKPFIDGTFRTMPEPEYTGIMGSSFGSILANYTWRTYPHIIGMAGLFSWTDRPAVNNKKLRKATKYKKFAPYQKVYFEIGENEASAKDLDDMHNMIYETYVKDFGLDPANAKFFIDPHGKHNEESWGRNFADAVCFLFGW